MKAIFKLIYLNLRGMLLNGIGFFCFRGAEPSEYASPAKILFIRIDRIGDLVLSTPALKAIKERYPEAELTALVSPVTAPLLAAAPGVSRVIVWDALQGWAGLAGTLKILKGLRFDLVIDPYADYELKTALIAFLSGAKVRAGYQVYGRGVFFNVPVAPARERVHFVKEAFGVLKALGIDAPAHDPELFTSSEAQGEARKFLTESGVDEHDLLVAIHPGGYYPSQRWMPERFAEVATGLISGYKAKVLLLGSGIERDLVEKTAGSISGDLSKTAIIKAVNLRTDVLCALIQQCQLFIGNNSGPLHMAGALKIPSVSTMGPTDPVRWRPIGPDQIVLSTDLPEGRRETRECMRNITAAMVLESAARLLGVLTRSNFDGRAK